MSTLTDPKLFPISPNGLTAGGLSDHEKRLRARERGGSSGGGGGGSGTVTDATTLAKGIVQLAGDIGGTASLIEVKNKLDVFNVMDLAYGATGDGTTNDTTAVQAAINAANSAGGGIVYFPKGTYLCSSLTGHSNIVFQGAGHGSVIKQVAGVADNTYLISVDGATPTPANNKTGIQIVNLQLRGTCDVDAFSSAFQHVHLIHLSAVSDVLISGCLIKGFRGDGIYLQGNDGANLRHNQRIKITETTFDGINQENRNGISIIDAEDVWIDPSCTFMNCSNPGVAPEGMPGAIDIEPNLAGSIVKDIRIGGHFKNIGGNAGVIGLNPFVAPTAPIKGITIDNVTIRDSPGSIPFLLYGVADAVDADPRADIVVSNSKVFGGTEPFEIRGLRGIRFENVTWDGATESASIGYRYVCRDVEINGCEFIECSTGDYPAITLYNGHRVSIDGNDFDNCGVAPGPTDGVALKLAVGLTTSVSSAVRFTRNHVHGARMLDVVEKSAGHTNTAGQNRYYGNVVTAGLAPSYKGLADPYPTLGNDVAPADASVATREVFHYFDPVAPQLKVKGRDSTGALFTRMVGEHSRLGVGNAAVANVFAAITAPALDLYTVPIQIGTPTWDITGHTGGAPRRISLITTSFVGGSNGGRPGIAAGAEQDNAQLQGTNQIGGSSPAHFFNPFQQTHLFGDKGTLVPYAGNVIISKPTGTTWPYSYSEAAAGLIGGIQAKSKGCLAEVFEGGVVVYQSDATRTSEAYYDSSGDSGPVKGQCAYFSIAENNHFTADYFDAFTTEGSKYTGARGVVIQSYGYRRLGTGLHFVSGGLTADEAAGESSFVRTMVLSNTLGTELSCWDGFGRWGIGVTRSQTANLVGLPAALAIDAGVVGSAEGIELTNFNRGLRIWKRASGTTNSAIAIGLNSAGTDSTANEDGIGFGTDIYFARTGNLNLQTNATIVARFFSAVGTAGLGFLQFGEQSTAPSTPAAGYVRLYAWDNGGTTEIRYKPDDGIPVTLGTTAGFISSVTDTNTIDHTVASGVLSSIIPTTADIVANSLGIGVTSATPATSDVGVFVSNSGLATILAVNSTDVFRVYGVDGSFTTPLFKLNIVGNNVALTWGAGGAATDTRLVRSAAGTLALTNQNGAGAGHLTFPIAASTINFTLGGSITAPNAGAGLKIGTATNDKLSFFNAATVTQRAAITAPTGGVVNDAEARTAINSIRQVLIDLGLTA